MEECKLSKSGVYYPQKILKPSYFKPCAGKLCLERLDRCLTCAVVGIPEHAPGCSVPEMKEDEAGWKVEEGKAFVPSGQITFSVAQESHSPVIPTTLPVPLCLLLRRPLLAEQK